MKNCSWISVIAGIWLIIAPFVLGYSANTAALWNDIVVGIIILAAGGYFLSKKGA